MTITVNHKFISTKGDGTDATVVRPTNWNDSHDIKLAANSMIGRMTAGPGLAEEIPASTFMMGLLATADFAALAVALGLPTTGDAKLTFKRIADPGWILANDGSIGDGLSGATTLAHNTQTTALFTFFYNTFSDAIAPLQLSTGALTTRAAQGAAATAFGNHCRMVIPRQLGRALIIAGTGGGLTARAVGDFGGFETHTLVASEIAAHKHGFTGSISGTATGGTNCGSGTANVNTSSTQTTGSTYTDHIHDITISGGVSGTGQWLHSHGITVSGGQSGSGGGLAATTAVTGNNNGGGGGAFGVVTGGATINNTDLNHAHGHNISASMGGATNSYPNAQNHTHDIKNINSTGSCTINSITVTMSATATCSGTTNDNTGGGGAHNNMQPWAAWNIMIKL